jgi:hypothetical protein
MTDKKYTIELGFDELCLIERALELYGRVGLLQFEHLTLCNSLQKLVWDRELSQEFKSRTDEVKSLFGYQSNANPGIFNKEIVGDDCRIAIHIYQQLRHQRYLDRRKSGEQTKDHYSVDEYSADTCQIAGMRTPNFAIK